MPITPLPTPPTRDDPTTFSSRADAFLSALPTFATEANALAVDANADAVAAAASELAATAAASAAIAATNVTKWVSGTTYAQGVVVWSPITYLSYRRKIAGAGTTDPSADSTNWALVAGTGDVTLAGAQTLTNKRIDPRNVVAASAATLTPDVSVGDIYSFTALAAALTINAPIGTPTDGDKLIFRLLDNGTARALTWNATYTVIGTLLPTTTTINKTTYVGCIYNANNTRWDVLAVVTQA